VIFDLRSRWQDRNIPLSCPSEPNCPGQPDKWLARFALAKERLRCPVCRKTRSQATGGWRDRLGLGLSLGNKPCEAGQAAEIKVRGSSSTRPRGCVEAAGARRPRSEGSSFLANFRIMSILVDSGAGGVRTARPLPTKFAYLLFTGSRGVSVRVEPVLYQVAMTPTL
jgi:hypothetical protein